MSLTVARTGWPCSPNTSHSVVGQACEAGRVMPRSFRTVLIFSPKLPIWLMPVRSPLTSAMKTGTPMLENCSARVCKLTVLPVPVAPVIRPCRLASPGNSWQVVFAFWAISIGSAMAASFLWAGDWEKWVKVKSLVIRPNPGQTKGLTRGWTQQMGQYSTPQRPSRRKAGQDLDTRHP
ncbi:hypothetical protein D9M68_787400 [compost metagenome]